MSETKRMMNNIVAATMAIEMGLPSSFMGMGYMSPFGERKSRQELDDNAQRNLRTIKQCGVCGTCDQGRRYFEYEESPTGLRCKSCTKKVSVV
jgi:hypothetical protein